MAYAEPMPVWIPTLITLLLPGIMLGFGTWFFISGNTQAMIPCLVLIGSAPLGIGFGYLLAGAAGRGALVTAGFYGLLLLSVVVMAFVPTQFEDAGILVSIVVIALAVLLTAAAGVAAWDVWRTLAARAAGGA